MPLFNEDVVRVLSEGQGMIVEFTPLETDESMKYKLIAPTMTEVIVDGDSHRPKH